MWFIFRFRRVFLVQSFEFLFDILQSFHELRVIIYILNRKLSFPILLVQMWFFGKG